MMHIADPPGALLAASYLPWTAQQRLAVVITDAPCHGKDRDNVSVAGLNSAELVNISS